MTASWTDLDRELDAWAEAGRVATFWWRDDDAVSPGSALDRLLDMASAAGAPIALAVIPARAEAGLADRHAGVAVLQHGYAHANHAPADAKKAELGAHRPPSEMAADLAVGRARLRDLFGPCLLPVLVPPWNRIAPDLLPLLPGCGIRAVSTFRDRATARPAPGLFQSNCHIDPIAWHGNRGFAGDACALAQAVGHLRARRAGTADPAEPTGLLTHHLVTDRGGWDFIAAFLARTAHHPATRWLPATQVFSGTS